MLVAVALAVASIPMTARAQCAPNASDFQITVVDASDPALMPVVPLPSVSVTNISGSGGAGCNQEYEIQFSLDDAITLGALQFEADYASGDFVGVGDQVECTSPLSSGGAFVTFFDEDNSDSLHFAAVALSGFTGPAVVGHCLFRPAGFETTTTTTTSTTTTTNGGLTTTTLEFPDGPVSCECEVTWTLTSADTIGQLQYDTDYGAAMGAFDGIGSAVNCTALAGDFTAFNDIEAEQKLSTAMISTAGVTGPKDISRCLFFTENRLLRSSDFELTITDQSAPDFTPTNATMAITDVDCECTRTPCGDGILNPGEECDDGNMSNDDACLTNCVAATCGDGFVQRSVEACDDGNDLNTDECLIDCTVARCGDGFVQQGVEQCDDGNLSNNDECLATCKTASCGDGFTNVATEECDDGNQSNRDECRRNCTLAFCGDGFVRDGSEECDDGNLNDNDQCRNDCLENLCGDGVRQSDREQCDDGNRSNKDACLNTCRLATCGDGFVHKSVEECDDIGESTTCDPDCTLAKCGDGHVNESAGEQCDDGLVVICGDANADQKISAQDAQIALGAAVELIPCSLGRCDVNNSGEVTAQDALAILNRAVGLPGELLCPITDEDPLNGDDSRCLANCMHATCGDGLIHDGVEECDDAGETLVCDANCTNAGCGDGDLNRTAGESCDDGNRLNRDDCLNSCVPARCGDGVTHRFDEDCDDGNDSNGDACLNNCEDARCGDGHVRLGIEECDGNKLQGETCESRGYDSGQLRCFGRCEIDERRCANRDGWDGSWESRSTDEGGAIRAILDTDTFGFSGTVELDGSFCISRGEISGEFSGATNTEVEAYADFEFDTQVYFIGLRDGRCMRGIYQIDFGPCDGDFGTWQVCR